MQVFPTLPSPTITSFINEFSSYALLSTIYNNNKLILLFFKNTQIILLKYLIYLIFHKNQKHCLITIMYLYKVILLIYFNIKILFNYIISLWPSQLIY